MAETSVQYTFPQEEPATKDFTLWNEAINLLCSGSTILPRALGAFLVPPHLPMEGIRTAIPPSYTILAGRILLALTRFIFRETTS